MNRKTAGQAVAVVVLVGLATWNFLRMAPGRSMDLKPYDALGLVAGEETSKLVGGTGEVGLVMPDDAGESNPVMDAQVKAFKKGLAAAGQVRVGRVSRVVMDGFTAMRTGGAVPAEQLASLLEGHRSAQAVVFFVGLPLADEHVLGRGILGDRKVVVVSAPFPWYPAMVQEGLLHLALVSKPGAGAGAEEMGSRGSPREVFDRDYVVMRSGTAKR